jgi:hypothetical protein
MKISEPMMRSSSVMRSILWRQLTSFQMSREPPME